jgi:hypothetical protein
MSGALDLGAIQNLRVSALRRQLMASVKTIC